MRSPLQLMALALQLSGMLAGHDIAHAADARKLTEEELKASEQVLPPKEGSRRVAFNTQMVRQPALAYFDYFDSQFANIKAKTNEQRQAATDPDAAKSPPAALDTPAEKGLRSASDAALTGSFIAGDLKGGLIQGTPAHTASNVLLGVAIAFDVLNWLSRDTTDRDIRYQSLKAMRNPSLYLYRFAPEVKGDDEFYQEIVKSQQQIEALGIGCEPAYFHSQVPTTRGYAVTEWLRARRFVCGYKDGEELGIFARVRELRELVVYQPVDRPVVVSFVLTRLDNMEYMPTILGLDKDKMDTAGKELYEKIAPKLDPAWTVVFTAPTANGEWHAFAARNGYVVEFPAIPDH